jgi:TRAP-type C4-dicarboxylate transport system permease small subunit
MNLLSYICIYFIGLLLTAKFSINLIAENFNPQTKAEEASLKVTGAVVSILWFLFWPAVAIATLGGLTKSSK